MEIMENQILYKCSYCGKRLLTKQGCILHEKEYCNDNSSPRIIKMLELKRKAQENCKHEKTHTHYDYIPGEAIKEPQYEVCNSCGYIF